jgi:uncharacterized protein GlcG (DUF336 family)
MSLSALTLADARQLITLAQEKAAEFGKSITVAVVDAGGYLVALDRQDRARPLTPSIATSKAYSAAIMQRPTKMLEAWRNSDPVFFSQVARMGLEPVVATEGGITIKRGDDIIGGLGVSGGRPEEDEEIALSALRQAGYDLEFDAWGQLNK